MARIDWARYKLQELALVVGRRIQYTSNFVAYFGVTPSVFSALYSKAEGKTSSKALAAGLHLLKHYPTASTADCALFGVGSFTTYERLAWNGIEYLSCLSHCIWIQWDKRLQYGGGPDTLALALDTIAFIVRTTDDQYYSPKHRKHAVKVSPYTEHAPIVISVSVFSLAISHDWSCSSV